MNIQKHKGDQDKHRHKGKEEHEPREAGVSGTAKRVKYPSPEDNVKHLNRENTESASHTAFVVTNTVFINIA